MRGWLRVKGASRISAAIRHSVASWTATPRPQRIAVQHDGGALPFQKADGRPPVLIKPGLAWFAGIAGISPVLRLINAVARVDQVAQDMRAPRQAFAIAMEQQHRRPARHGWRLMPADQIQTIAGANRDDVHFGKPDLGRFDVQKIDGEYQPTLQ